MKIGPPFILCILIVLLVRILVVFVFLTLVYPFAGSLGHPRVHELRYAYAVWLCLCRFGPYFVEPIVAGLKEDNKPFISAFDLIGAPVMTDDFVVGGTCTNNLYGMCESLYRPNMVSKQERRLRSAPRCMRHIYQNFALDTIFSHL